MDIALQYHYLLGIRKQIEPKVSLDEIAEYMKSAGKDGFSKGNMSKGAFKFDKKKRCWVPGELKAEQLKVLLEGLEWYYKKEHRISFNAQKQVYKDDQDREFPLPDVDLTEKEPDNLDGVICVHAKFPQEEICRRISQASHVRMIQTFLSAIEVFIEAFDTCLSQGGRIEIMLVEPHSTAASLRQKGIDRSTDIIGKFVEAIPSLEDLAAKHPDKMEIRFYNQLPGMELFIIDDRMYYGMYWYRTRTRYGSYFEVLNRESFSLASDLQKHWQHLWASGIKKTENTHTFVCHFLRNNEIKHLTLEFNTSNNGIDIVESPSGDTFTGNYEEIRELYISANLVTQHNHNHANRPKRVASFLMYKGDRPLSETQIMIGIYNVIAVNDKMYGNLVLLERKTSVPDAEIRPGDPKKVAQNAPQLVQEFLKYSEISADRIDLLPETGLREFLIRKDSYWERKARLLAKLAGYYYCYYTFEDFDKKRWIAQRLIKIDSSGVATKFAYDQNSIEHTFTVKALDTRSVAIYNNKPEGHGTSYFLGFIKNPQSCRTISGEFVGLANDDSIKKSWLFMVRMDENSPVQTKNYAPDDPFIQELKNEYEEFKEKFATW